MNKSNAELIIITGGSEVTSLAIANAAMKAGIPYAVFSLVKDSLLRKSPNCVAWLDLHPFISNHLKLREKFLYGLDTITISQKTKVAILPTEDGGLRILNEFRDDVLLNAEFSRARHLRMGGIDKAEAAEAIINAGGIEGIAPTLILNNPNEAIDAFHTLGRNCIFKPALKPLDMDLSGLGPRGIKVITQKHHHESPDDVIKRLEKAWSTSQRWVAQPRLLTGANLERSVCTVRGNDHINACQVIERAKFPKIGGTALWVATERKKDLIPSATRLLQAMDVIGICELSYLPDASGSAHMIEFNTRPWLQTELIQSHCFPIITDTIATLRGQTPPPAPLSINYMNGDWIQIERAALAAAALQMNPTQFIKLSFQSIKRSTIIAGYSNTPPCTRVQMAKRSLKKAIPRR